MSTLDIEMTRLVEAAQEIVATQHKIVTQMDNLADNQSRLAAVAVELSERQMAHTSGLGRLTQSLADVHGTLHKLVEANNSIFEGDKEMMRALTSLAAAQYAATAAGAEGYLTNQYLIGFLAQAMGCTDVEALIERCQEQANQTVGLRAGKAADVN